MEFEKIVRENPVLAAVKDEAELEEVLKSDGVQIIFVLFGDVCIIPGIVERIKDRGKFAIVHADLVEGLSSKEVVVDYLKSNTRLDGIISTKQSIIRRGIELGLFTVLRCFVLDTKSLINLQRWLDSGVKPDVVELMPGIAPKIIRLIRKTGKGIPVIAGGLITEEWEVREALVAGAVAVSTTSSKLWFMYEKNSLN